MIKSSEKHDLRKIDEYMKEFILNLNRIIKPNVKILACCEGHRIYPMTIVIKFNGRIYELFSGIGIPRKRKFYKKDKHGYYYIPEVIEKCKH